MQTSPTLTMHGTELMRVKDDNEGVVYRFNHIFVKEKTHVRPPRC